MLNLDYRDARPIYEQVRDGLRRLMVTGAIQEGEQLPSVRALAREIGVNPNTVAKAYQELERQGALVIDCDAVYHELLASNTAMLAEINARFPGTIENGTLQRKRLGAVVFADAAALDDLNAITHRYVRAEVRARLRAWARQGGTVAAIDAIALIESGLAELCTVTIGVTAPREVRIERLIAREGVTRDYAEARIDAQKPNEWFAQHCSYVLDNGGTLADFQRRCHQLIQEVLS